MSVAGIEPIRFEVRSFLLLWLSTIMAQQFEQLPLLPHRNSWVYMRWSDAQSSSQGVCLWTEQWRSYGLAVLQVQPHRVRGYSADLRQVWSLCLPHRVRRDSGRSGTGRGVVLPPVSMKVWLSTNYVWIFKKIEPLRTDFMIKCYHYK